MHFQCKCGSTITDTTDFLPYKASLVSDQDAEDVPEHAAALTRHMYQCDQCGRLYVEDQSRALKSFAPESATDNILASTRGDAWKANLRAHWSTKSALRMGDQPGSLFCDSAVKNGGVFLTFDAWEALERAYFKEFEKRRELGTLRSALLRKDDTLIHCWDFKTPVA